MSTLENGHAANGHANGHAGNGHIEKFGNGRPINRAVTPGGHPLDTSQPAFPVYHRRFANPAPLGLIAFAATTLLLSLVNVNTRGVTTPNIVVGMAFGYGGLVQLLAGMWEFAAGNTFGATAFSSYGGFWISYACLQVPWFGIRAQYATEAEFANAVGLFLFSWMVVTFLFFLATFRSSVGLVSVFFFLTLTFLLLGTAELTGRHGVAVAGGAFGIITAFAAFYVALAGLLTPDSSYFIIPVGSLSKRDY